MYINLWYKYNTVYVGFGDPQNTPENPDEGPDAYYLEEEKYDWVLGSIAWALGTASLFIYFGKICDDFAQYKYDKGENF